MGRTGTKRMIAALLAGVSLFLTTAAACESGEGDDDGAPGVTQEDGEEDD